ncbi:MAG: hypothetical protein AB7J46_06395 [Candidatus Altimarinota bacterium]
MSGIFNPRNPGGSDTQIQFNDGGVFGGDSGLVFNKTTNELTLAGLLDVSGASAGQIEFPATQNASSNANTLDDYEEGTWTPIFTAASGSGATHSSQIGGYVKVGQLVHAWGDVTMSGKGTLSGHLRIGGFPFTASNIVAAQALAIGFFSGYSTSVVVIYGHLAGSGTSVDLYHQTAAATAASATQVTDVSTSARLMFACTYRASA